MRIIDSCQVPNTGSGISRYSGKALRGSTHHLVMHLRCCTEGQVREQACLGSPDAFALERKQGNHTPSPGFATARGTGFWVRFSGVVSAGPLADR